MSTDAWIKTRSAIGWRKGDFDMQLVVCPRTGKPVFVGTKPKGLRLPRETKGKRWRAWRCSCGAHRTIVAWKNARGRRLYLLTDFDWAKKHESCGEAAHA